MWSFYGDLASLILDHILEKIIFNCGVCWVYKVTFTIDKFVNINIPAVLKSLVDVLSLLESITLSFDKLIENLAWNQIVFRVILLISKSNAVLDNQDLSILDWLDKAFDAYGIKKPVPSLFGNFRAVSIRVEVVFAVEVEAERFFLYLFDCCFNFLCLDVDRCDLTRACLCFQRVASFN